MTHRERVKTALDHREPDRVPIDNGGGVSGMHEVAYRNLLDHLGMKDDISIYDPVQRLARVKDEVLDLLGVDTRYLFANAPSFWAFEEREDGSWVDEFGTGYERSEYYCDYTHPVLAQASMEDLRRYRFPDPRDAGRFEGLGERARDLYKKTDFALVGGNIQALFYIGWVLRGMEQFMMDVVINTEFANYLMDRIVEWHLAFLDEYLSEIGEYIEYHWIGDDWGVQQGQLISLEMFRDMVGPRFREMISFIKSKTEARVIYHTCGATAWIIEDLIDLGVDIVGPLQANAAGNQDPAKLKKAFGGRIAFHGNTNNQGVFHRGKNEVVADALYRLRHLAPGGGYIFSSGHNIQANVPPENILALFGTAREFGTYPIDVERIEAEIEKVSSGVG
jgi:uroporphyrinogen decarboxylase